MDKLEDDYRHMQCTSYVQHNVLLFMLPLKLSYVLKLFITFFVTFGE